MTATFLLHRDVTAQKRPSLKDTAQKRPKKEQNPNYVSNISGLRSRSKRRVATWRGMRETRKEREERGRGREQKRSMPLNLFLSPLSQKKKTRTPAASTTPARPPPPPPSPAATPPPSPPRSASRSGRSATNARGPASTSGTSEGRGRCGPFGETTSKRPTGSSGSSTLPTGRDCETARSS